MKIVKQRVHSLYRDIHYRDVTKVSFMSMNSFLPLVLSCPSNHLTFKLTYEKREMSQSTV